jgi:protein O-mannosyl-transferase
VIRFRPWFGLALIVAMAGGLYLPFLRNPLVFDDWTLFGGARFAYFATHPFDFLNTRNLPYFSLAISYILGSGIPIQRIVSLVLHIACALTFFKLLHQMLEPVLQGRAAGSIEGPTSQAANWAFFGAAAFAIHPVAVYGAGYLIQRSITLATLFSLLSILMFLRGLRRGAHADAVSAALLYTLAVYSKEHSLLLPAAAAMIAILATQERRFALRHSAIYLALCAPAAVMVALLSKGIVGTTYEPDFGAVSDQLEGVFGLDIGGMSKSLSAVTQAGLFFEYLLIWIWPDLRAMSIDLRIDVTQHLSTGWVLLKISAFVFFGALGLLLLLRRGRPGLIGFGMLYVWILFLVELSVARFQEPFVLYRSYLWAPGILIAGVAALSAVPRRAMVLLSFIVFPVLLYQANNRLVTFSHPFLLWQDAVAKLPSEPVPWGSRALHNLAREYMYVSKPDKAIELIDRCMTQYPNTYHCYFAKGAILFDLGDLEAALPFLVRAVALNPKRDMAHQRLALTLEKLGRVEEAMVVLRNASKLGFTGADMEIKRLTSGGPKPHSR